jgi:hypothetical protein
MPLSYSTEPFENAVTPLKEPVAVPNGVWARTAETSKFRNTRQKIRVCFLQQKAPLVPDPAEADNRVLFILNCALRSMTSSETNRGDDCSARPPWWARLIGTEELPAERKELGFIKLGLNVEGYLVSAACACQDNVSAGRVEARKSTP